MAWRVVEHGETVWNVAVAAERAPQTSTWQLVLSFRAAGPERASFWTPYPLVSASKSALFAQAEQISNEKLTAVLVDHLR
ncbi:MAG: hypothetical protein ABI679_07005 [Gemmatimonadota bacterium]